MNTELRFFLFGLVTRLFWMGYRLKPAELATPNQICIELGWGVLGCIALGWGFGRLWKLLFPAD
jgi:hypothetical protein